MRGLEARSLTRAAFEAQYRIIDVSGWGGMGQIHRAVQLALNRPVAIKTINTELAGESEIVQRFVQEARSLSRISHPNIVQIYDFGLKEGQPFLVMELVEGTDLMHLLASGVPLDQAEALRVVIEVLAGLEAIHAAGLLHRDLKPSNVLVAADGSVKIADFGAVRDLRATTITMTGAVVGTPMYMAPEQLLAETLTPRADLYAVGVMLWEMLVGELPRAASHDAQKFVMMRSCADALPLASVRPGLPAQLALVVDALLRRQPERRPATAREARRLVESAQSAPATGRGARQVAGRAGAGTAGPATVPLTGLAKPARGATRVSMPPRREGMPVMLAGGGVLLALCLTFMLWRPPGRDPDARTSVPVRLAPLETLKMNAERSPVEVRLSFRTERPARVKARAVAIAERSTAPDQQALPAIEGESPAGRDHRLTLKGLDPWLTYQVDVELADGGEVVHEQLSLPSPLPSLRSLSRQSLAREMAQLVVKIRGLKAVDRERAVQLSNELHRLGWWPGAHRFAKAWAELLNPPAGRELLDVEERRVLLSRIVKVRRLDRAMVRDRIDVSTGIESILGGWHSVTPPDWPGGAREVPAEMSGPLLLFPGRMLRAALKPLPVARLRCPPHGAYREARLVAIVEGLGPEQFVRVDLPSLEREETATAEGRRLILELWAPPEAASPGQAVKLVHTFDPRLLVEGAQDVALSWGDVEGDYARVAAGIDVNLKPESIDQVPAVKLHSLALYLR